MQKALNLKADKIRCTSVDGYRLPGGVNTDEQLRIEVHDSKMLIGIVTPNSLTSAFVLFELGARWDSLRPMIPLLSKGANSGLLKGPLQGINCLSCDSSAQLHQLIDEVADILEISKQNTASYQNKIEELVFYSTQFSKVSSVKDTKDEELILEDGVYWIRKKDDKQGPFCQVCKDKDNKIIRLVNEDVDVGDSETVHTRFCRVCGYHQ